MSFVRFHQDIATITWNDARTKAQAALHSLFEVKLYPHACPWEAFKGN